MQAGHISSTISDLVGFIKRATPGMNHQNDNYIYLKMHNQLRGVTLNDKVKSNLALIVFGRGQILALWRVTTTTFWIATAIASSSD